MTAKQKRDITIEDVIEFVDKRAQAANHPLLEIWLETFQRQEIAVRQVRLKKSANRRLPLPMAMLVKKARFGNVCCAPSNTGYCVVRASEKSLRKKDSNLYANRDCVTTVYRLATWQNLPRKKVSVKWRISELEESTQWPFT